MHAGARLGVCSCMHANKKSKAQAHRYPRLDHLGVDSHQHDVLHLLRCKLDRWTLTRPRRRSLAWRRLAARRRRILRGGRRASAVHVWRERRRRAVRRLLGRGVDRRCRIQRRCRRGVSRRESELECGASIGTVSPAGRFVILRPPIRRRAKPEGRRLRGLTQDGGSVLPRWQRRRIEGVRLHQVGTQLIVFDANGLHLAAQRIRLLRRDPRRVERRVALRSNRRQSRAHLRELSRDALQLPLLPLVTLLQAEQALEERTVERIEMDRV